MTTGKGSKQKKREQFIEFRMGANLTQEELSIYMGISRQAINRIETGYEDRTPTDLQLRTAEIIAYLAITDHLGGLAEFLDCICNEEQ